MGIKYQPHSLLARETMSDFPSDTTVNEVVYAFVLGFSMSLYIGYKFDLGSAGFESIVLAYLTMVCILLGGIFARLG